MFPKGFGGFFIEGFFELFEVILSYITNTLSFLRVGGFILAHAGMMLVVYTLMDSEHSMMNLMQRNVLAMVELHVANLQMLYLDVWMQTQLIMMLLY